MREIHRSDHRCAPSDREASRGIFDNIISLESKCHLRVRVWTYGPFGAVNSSCSFGVTGGTAFGGMSRRRRVTDMINGICSARSRVVPLVVEIER